MPCPFEINGLCHALRPQGCGEECEAKGEDGKIRYGEVVAKVVANYQLERRVRVRKSR